MAVLALERSRRETALLDASPWCSYVFRWSFTGPAPLLASLKPDQPEKWSWPAPLASALTYASLADLANTRTQCSVHDGVPCHPSAREAFSTT